MSTRTVGGRSRTGDLAFVQVGDYITAASVLTLQPRLMSARFELNIPSFCDDEGFPDSILTYLEHAVLAAFAEEIAHPTRRRHADVALASYVDYLRTRGAPPEAMLICMKKVLHASVVSSLPEREATAYRADVISRCIAAYFAPAPRDG